MPQHYTFEICTERPGLVATTAGYDLHVSSSLEALSSADTVVIPGWLPVAEGPSEAVSEAILAAHRRGARIVTLCSGVWALPATGLLDGRSATTHWGRAGLLRATFPAITVEDDVLFVDHGDVATSGGAGAGLDLCLHLVGKDHGDAYATFVAEHMRLPVRGGTPSRPQGWSRPRVDAVSGASMVPAAGGACSVSEELERLGRW